MAVSQRPSTFLHETAASARAATAQDEILAGLQRSLGSGFTLLDGVTAEVLANAGQQPSCDWWICAQLCREAVRRGKLEILGEDDPVAALMLPFATRNESFVAAGLFVTRPVAAGDYLGEAAHLLGLEERNVLDWAVHQTPLPVSFLRRMGELVLSDWNSKQRIHELEQESFSLSNHLGATYEEISLLHRLTNNLKLSHSDEDLSRVAIEWLDEVLPAEALVIELLPIVGKGETLTHEARNEARVLTSGSCPMDRSRLDQLIAYLGFQTTAQPLVVNRGITQRADWPFPEIRQMVAAPLVEGENLFGWLMALNRPNDEEYGTVEASLLSSVATILGIHGGNIELYRQQSELLAGVIRALTSAIDAKDPYTCGHSDRVARMSVRLAQELGWEGKSLDMIYLSGLLHDIGKIGVSDAVLRKPGKLSDVEYEHIKHHVQIGHKILMDLKKLGDVLPVVLYHHESWDGKGYPHSLATQAIPRMARIVSVADSYDAMASDRPYRKGMPDERIDEIFRAGSGQQWDPEIVEAFFRVRDDLKKIARHDWDSEPESAQPSRS